MQWRVAFGEKADTCQTNVNFIFMCEIDSGVLPLTLAALSLLTIGGVVFGISALYPVLYRERVWADSCTSAEVQHCPGETTTQCCDAQLLGVTLVSTLALLPSDGLVALYGEFVDRHGPRKCFLVAALLAWLGLLLLGVNAAALDADGIWLAGFFCLGAAGPGIFFSVLFLAEKYPRLQPLIIALAAGAFDGSAICFYLWNMAYFRLGLSLAQICAGWLVLSVVIGVATLRYLPSWRWLQSERLRRRASLAYEQSTAAETGAVHGADSAGGEAEAWRPLDRSAHEPPGDPPRKQPPVKSGRLAELAAPLLKEGAARAEGEAATASAGGGGGGRGIAPLITLRSQMLRVDTLLLTGTMAACNLKATFFIMTLSDQTRTIFGRNSEVAGRIDATFNTCFPLGALLTSFFASRLLRRFAYRPHVYMGVAVLGMNLFSLLTLMQHPLALTAGAALFGPTRTLLWSCYFHFMNQPWRYSRRLSGRMLGYCNLLIALASDLPPYALSWVAVHRGEGYIAVNLGLQLLTLCCLAFPLHLWRVRAAARGARAAGQPTRGPPLSPPLGVERTDSIDTNQFRPATPANEE